MIVLLVLAAACLPAETHQIVPTKLYNSFDHRHPVLARIRSGDTVVTKTADAGGYDWNGKKAGERGNPLTGPFYVEGAAPGDSIAIRFTRIRMNRNYGFTTYRLGAYAVTPESMERTYGRSYQKGAVVPERDDIVRWNIDLAKATVKLSAPQSKVHAMEFQAKPMLGCAGVAAPGVFAPTSGISGNYGGNMDYNRLVEGTTLYLPVFHAGALFFIGDGHALQGDGEPTGTGVETSMDVTFEVVVRKGVGLENPRLETAEWIVSIGSQPEFVSSLDRTIRVATTDMVEWLVREYKMEPWAAHLLIGYRGQYDVITVGGSMGLRLSKADLPKR
ncbi:MAG: acetamidase/formamidase family protein [Bryobacterales bacterium]|nr:acetamidase/formamidase family protein [Bryobacterales bacterium]